ncbi:MAG TPA: preprotein translocase subunit SecE [Dehalococcoidia bacterium]|nr:preprotein translocase subunit SecE [Dehalococcoidia bacterium]
MNSRQMRRHPVDAKPAKQRAIRPSLRASRPAAVGRDSGRRGLAALRPAWLEDVFSELRKVQWPTPQEAWNLTVVVIVVCIAFGIATGVIDFVFQWLLQHVVSR